MAELKKVLREIPTWRIKNPFAPVSCNAAESRLVELLGDHVKRGTRPVTKRVLVSSQDNILLPTAIANVVVKSSPYGASTELVLSSSRRQLEGMVLRRSTDRDPDSYLWHKPQRPVFTGALYGHNPKDPGRPIDIPSLGMHIEEGYPIYSALLDLLAHLDLRIGPHFKENTSMFSTWVIDNNLLTTKPR